MIIAFTGGMGSGKSTAISMVGNKLKNLELIKFAGPLYDIQEMVYRRIRGAYRRPQDFKKDRKLLQWIGTEWGRGLSETLWVDIWKKATSEAVMQGFNVVCDDVRFNNEAETIHALGGVVIKLIRSDNENKAEGGIGIKGHASEAGVSANLIDFTIENNGTLEEFQEKLKRVLAEVTGQTLRQQ